MNVLVTYNDVCFFYFCVCVHDEYLVEISNNTSMFNLSILFDGKVNIVGALVMSKLPVIFKSTEKHIKKNKENQEFLRKISFRQNQFWFLV